MAFIYILFIGKNKKINRPTTKEIAAGKSFTQKACEEADVEEIEKGTGKKRKVTESETSAKPKRKKGIKTDIILSLLHICTNCFAGEDKPKGAIIQLTRDCFTSAKPSESIFTVVFIERHVF